MKYALVNGERHEAQPDLSGKCPCCESPVIAKCGEIKIRHWAHKGKLMCDPWWENETEWHRDWKGQFPKEWQEIIHFAENGEKHIADVKTDQDYVIEFQHSSIKPEERQSREGFYKKVIWIVDGTRRQRDKDKFIDVWQQSKTINEKIEARQLISYFDECSLLRDWRDSTVPVFFDFHDDVLWLLLPKTIEGRYIFRMRRSELISYLLPASPMRFEALLEGMDKFLRTTEELYSKHQHIKHLHNSLGSRRMDRNKKRL